jgi:FkbM family methyltransferase
MIKPLIDKFLYDIFFREYKVNENDIAISLGAGKGEETQYLSERVGPNGKVFAIEADPRVFAVLQHNISKYKYKNVIALNIAIADFEGSINIVDLGGTGSANYIQKEASENSVSVQCTTMDKFVSDYELEKIDYIKVNIEGAEVEFLKGFQEKYQIVKNWCISCHDFTGVESQKTFNFVTNFFKEKNVEFRTYNDIPNPIIEFYVYV